MTTTNYQPAPPSPERLDQIREALARLANPDVAFARPHTWAAMLRDTMAGLDQLTAQLSGDRTAYRLSIGETITCGHYTTPDEARRHAEAAADTEAGPLKSPVWVTVSPDDEVSSEALCHTDDSGYSVGTGYVVTPISIRAAYDPAAAW